MIITSHADNCLWKQRGCDGRELESPLKACANIRADSIFKLSLNHAPTTLHAIRERYDSLCALKNKLPYMHDMHSPDGFNLNAVLAYLPKDFFKPQLSISAKVSSESQADELNEVALMMALFGWRGRPDHTPDVGAAGCDSCFRTLGLWLFKTKEVTEAGAIIKPASMKWLDPVEEHRSYCPWSNSKSQSGNLGKKTSQSTESPGWEIVLRVLKNENRLRSGGNMETEEIKRPTTSVGPSGQGESVFGADIEDDDAKSIREEKDKERWARLRRVKSLFDAKGVKKLQRGSVNLDARGKASS